jgi:hypothetical protein
MRAIYIEFDKEGIEIPKGQKDIQVNFPGSVPPGPAGDAVVSPPGR